MPQTVRSELTGLGLQTSRRACRRELIELLWERKRPLMRQLHEQGDSPPPAA